MVYLLAVLAGVVAIAFIVGYYLFRKDSLYVLGIGSAVSANVYNVHAYSIEVGRLVFGLDSVIYILFAFCIVVACKDFGKKSAKAITYSSMAGIMLTATFDFFAQWATIGIAENVIWGFVSFAVSVVAIYISTLVGLWIFEKLKTRLPNFLSMGLSIITLSIINSCIFFGIMYIIGADLFGSFWGTLAGSFIGKCGAIIVLLLAYEVVKLLDKRKLNKQSALAQNASVNDVLTSALSANNEPATGDAKTLNDVKTASTPDNQVDDVTSKSNSEDCEINQKSKKNKNK